MESQELNQLRYSFQTDGRNICNNLARSLQLVSQGDTKSARRLFEQADDQFKALKTRQKRFEKRLKPQITREQRNSIAFMDILRDSVRQASFLDGKNSPVRYHIYA